MTDDTDKHTPAPPTRVGWVYPSRRRPPPKPKPIPNPRTQISLKLTPVLKRSLKREADLLGLSMNAFIVGYMRRVVRFQAKQRTWAKKAKQAAAAPKPD